jgi:hypothetical protein
MINSFRNTSFLKYIVLAFCVVWLVYFMLNNEIPTDPGDGIMHFFIAQGSWYQPELFLHHWGKPFFILVSSPFAQFGFNGMVVFNILIFTSTVLIAFRILSKLGVSVWLQLLFPLILLVAHDFSETILGGMTEPLFNLALMLALLLLQEKKFMWFAIVLSLMPFMRSEGQLPVVLGFFLLLYNKSYKHIPFLATGFIVYAFVGLIVYHDFWWYFTRSAYNMENGIYGKGPWNHYLVSYKNYLGNPGLYIVLLGIPSMIILAIKKRWKDLQLEWWFFAYGIVVGVIVLHSYFLATGQNGALGLTRIATQGIPIFVLLHLYYLSRFKLFNHVGFTVVFGIFAGILVTTLVQTKIYPKKATALEHQLIAAADFMKQQTLGDSKVYYHYPLFSFRYGENPFQPDRRLIHYSFADFDESMRTVLKPGDFIVRDSHFGPMEANVQLKDINRHPELVIVAEFVSSEQLNDALNETEGVIIYQYIPVEKQSKIASTKKMIAKNKLVHVKESEEFTALPSVTEHYSTETKLYVNLEAKANGLKIVYDYNNKEDYSIVELKANEAIENTYLFRTVGKGKLYIWNPDKVETDIQVNSIYEEKVAYHPIMK